MRHFGLLLLLLALLCSSLAFGQEAVLKGYVRDAEDASGIEGAIVTLLTTDSKTTLGYALTDKGGAFEIKHKATTGKALLGIASMGYKNLKAEVELPVTEVRTYTLTGTAKLLDEVAVKAPLVVQRSDTTTFVVEKMKLETDRSIEDLLKRIPGITVDPKGIISYDGIPISRFYIEGLDMMKEKYPVATQSIHPDDVGSVSIYDHHEPRKVMKGETLPEAAAINITIKEGSKLRPIGYLYGAGGTGREPVLYRADLFGLLVRKEAQYLGSLKAGNTGETIQDLFTNGDLSRSPTDALTTQDPLGLPSIPLPHFRRSGDAAPTINAISRRDNGDIIQVSADYLHTSDRYTQSETASYGLGEGQEPILMDDSISTQKRRDEATVSLDFERNRDLSYLKNRTILRYSKARSLFGIRQKALDRNLSETLEEERIILSNQSEMILKGLLTEGNTQLQNSFRLLLKPHSDLSLQDDGNGESLIRNLSTTYLEDRLLLAQSFGLWSAYWTLNAKAGLKVSYTDLRSLQEGDFVLPGMEGLQGSKGEFRALEMVPDIALELVYHRGPARFTAEVPLEYRILGVLSKDGAKLPIKSFVASGLSLTLTYKLLSVLSLTADAGIRNDAGSVLQYYDRPIAASYRTMTALGSGSGPNFSTLYNGSISLRYKDLLNSRSGTLSLSYDYTARDFLTAQTIGKGGMETSFEQQKNGLSMLGGLLRFNQGVDDLHTVFGLTAGINLTSQTVKRNGTPLPFSLINASAAPTASISLFQNILNLNLSFEWAYTGADTGLELGENRNQSFSANATLIFSPLASHALEIRTKFTGLWHSKSSDLRSYNYYPYLSTEVLYKIPGSRWELSAEARNLMNSQVYQSTAFTGLDYTSSTVALRGRELLIGARLRF